MWAAEETQQCAVKEKGWVRWYLQEDMRSTRGPKRRESIYRVPTKASWHALNGLNLIYLSHELGRQCQELRSELARAEECMSLSALIHGVEFLVVDAWIWSESLSICICSVCVCVHVCVMHYVSVQVCTSVILCHFPPDCFEIVSHWTTTSLFSLAAWRASSKDLGINIEVTKTHSHTWLFTWVLGIQTQVLLPILQAPLPTEPSLRHQWSVFKISLWRPRGEYIFAREGQWLKQKHYFIYNRMTDFRQRWQCWYKRQIEFLRMFPM